MSSILQIYYTVKSLLQNVCYTVNWVVTLLICLQKLGWLDFRKELLPVKEIKSLQSFTTYCSHYMKEVYTILIGSVQ